MKRAKKFFLTTSVLLGITALTMSCYPASANASGAYQEISTADLIEPLDEALLNVDPVIMTDQQKRECFTYLSENDPEFLRTLVSFSLMAKDIEGVTILWEFYLEEKFPCGLGPENIREVLSAHE